MNRYSAAFATLVGITGTNFRICLFVAATWMLATPSSSKAGSLLTQILNNVSPPVLSADSSASFSGSISGNTYSGVAKAFATTSVSTIGLGTAEGNPTWALSFSVSDPSDPNNQDQVLLTFSGALAGTLSATAKGPAAASASIQTDISINNQIAAHYYLSYTQVLAGTTSHSVTPNLPTYTTTIQDGSTFEVVGDLDAIAAAAVLGYGSAAATSNFANTETFSIEAQTLPEPSSLFMGSIAALALLGIRCYLKKWWQFI